MASDRLLPESVTPGIPITALAPMQDVTTLPFMKVMHHYGAPDYFFTEYFRVHENSRLNAHILESITDNPSDKPVFAQLIGESIPDLKRTAEDLENYPIAGIDLNMGCPAPKVYKKNVGGGLLREISKVDQIFGTLRESINGLFTVKMRVGFENTENFKGLLELINKHKVDLLSLHGRTVKQMYRGEVNYDLIKHARESVNCPVIANGNISSVEKAIEVLDHTDAYGVMIGRSAIRNPWIFRQLREHFSGKPVFQPKLSDVREYVDILYQSTVNPEMEEKHHCHFLKKFLNFIGQSVDAESHFLKEMRRSLSMTELFKICDKHLLQDADKIFPNEPFMGVIARPNCEL